MEPDRQPPQRHFAFGRNWQSFLETLTDESVAAAVAGLGRLFPGGQLEGKSFLDVGCGAGLSMVAALRLGAGRVVGIDIDGESTEAASHCLARFAPHRDWDLFTANILTLAPEDFGRFDVVHSWGVLHHTGDMWNALARSASLTRDDGWLAIAIYAKTRFYRAWRIEKRIYSQLPGDAQLVVRLVYQLAFLGAKLILGKDPVGYLNSYRLRRGMSWSHDVHDWLGGYPYESAGPAEVRDRLGALGFRIVREFVTGPRRGLFGSSCDEYVARRVPAPRAR